MTIDPHTFGGSPAGEILAAKLNALAYAQLTRRVSSFLHHTFAGFSALQSIEDDDLFVEFVVLWRKNRVSKVAFRDEIDTFIRSIIVGVSRDWTRGVSERKAERAL